MKTMIIAIRATVVTLVLTGLLYPFLMTGFAQVLFPWRANGSLVMDEKGQVVGSELIAQGFANPAYFQPRPSAAGKKAMTRPLRRAPIWSDVEEVTGPYQRRPQTIEGGKSGSHRICSC